MKILITGASSGIGEATARAFAATGRHELILVARRKAPLQALAHALGATALPLDVSAEDAARQVSETCGEVDLLVNNAGLAAGLDKAQDAKWDDWQRMIDVNVTGVLRMTRAVLPGMVQRNRGHIINVGSVAGTYPYQAGNVYGATKAFLRQLTLNLKCDLLGTAVRVTSIEPGMVETEFSLVRFGGDAARAKAVYAGMQPLSAGDIADAIVWAALRPAHVNINSLELMPVAQAFAGFSVNRDAR